MSVMDNKNDRSLIERQVTTFERCTTCRWDWMQTTMTIIARGHTQSVERITHRQRPTSLCERSPHPPSHGELNAASLEYHIITDILHRQLDQFTLTGDPCIFSFNHMQQVRERQWRLPRSFVQCQHCTLQTTYLCVVYSNGAPVV